MHSGRYVCGWGGGAGVCVLGGGISGPGQYGWESGMEAITCLLSMGGSRAHRRRVDSPANIPTPTPDHNPSTLHLLGS